MAENALLSGPLEPTNEAYSVAKIVGVKLCEFYRKQYGSNFHSLMPCNLYGIGDNYHPENSHVLPGLLRKFHEAKGSQAGSVTIWGTGTPRREFLFADDLAEGCLHALSLEDPPSLLNIGYGSDVTVMELARLIADTVEYTGEIQLDPSKPDGVPQKLLDSSVINSLGWKPRTSLEEGLKLAYSDFCESESIRAK
jgi:GDP-L-fucose synthase